MTWLILFWVLSTLFSNTFPWPVGDEEWARWRESAVAVAIGFLAAWIIIMFLVGVFVTAT